MYLFSQNITSKDKDFVAKIYNTDFNDLDLSKVTQVCGLVLNQDNELLIVQHSKGYWLLPGGSV